MMYTHNEEHLCIILFTLSLELNFIYVESILSSTTNDLVSTLFELNSTSHQMYMV